MKQGKRLGRHMTKVHPFNNPGCIICAALKTPKFRQNGTLEPPYLLMRRKTCGRDTDCFNKLMSGPTNPNYKGYMPVCKQCGKKIYYRSAEDMKNGHFPSYCLDCWKPINRIQKLGKYPEHLKKFAFKKKVFSQ